MAGTVECLDRAQLQAFALGHVPQERETLLAAHVESCPVCVRNLAGVQQSDALLDAARRPVPPPTALVQNLVERVCALSADAEVTQELYTFLDPADSPTELGRLGVYRLLRVLGRGGMGVVFQAEDAQLQRQVAVKVLRPALLSSGGARQRFLREARAAARVVHERIGGDFNRDGHPDVAVENFGTHDVSILLGNGDGSLRPGGRCPVGAGPGGLAGGDFNADGVLDLVAANHGSHDLSFLIGNGDGSFRPADHRAAGWTPAGVAVGDFNGDGRADVAVVNYKSHTVSVFLNRPPAPLFRLSSPYQVVAGETYTLTVAALDARHRPDIAYRSKVRLSTSDAQAFLPADFVQPFPLLDGVQGPRVQFRSAGAHSWTATDVEDATRQGSVTILVLPGPTSVLRLRAPSHCTAGVAFPLTVTALDEFANTTPSYTGTLSFSGSDAAAAWPNDTQLDDGERHFEVTLHTPGPQTLTATDRRSVLLSGTTRLVVRPAKSPQPGSR